MPHGPRNPAAAKREIGVSAEQGGGGAKAHVLIEISFPMVAGIVITSAEEPKPPAPTVSPARGGFKKLNLNTSSERRLILVVSVGASKRLSISWESP